MFDHTQVIVSPLVRFTNKPGTRIEDINSPKGLLQSLGPFITGTYLDEEDVVAADSKASWIEQHGALIRQ